MTLSLRQHRDPLREDQEALRERLERELSDAGVSGRVFRVFPPYDSGERVEILLLGEDGSPYTIYLPADARSADERVIEAGW